MRYTFLRAGLHPLFSNPPVLKKESHTIDFYLKSETFVLLFQRNYNFEQNTEYGLFFAEVLKSI